MSPSVVFVGGTLHGERMDRQYLAHRHAAPYVVCRNGAYGSPIRFGEALYRLRKRTDGKAYYALLTM